MRLDNTKILVIIGPSGAGKSAIVRKLVKDQVVDINPSWTTRPQRPNEASESVEHIFVSDKEFDEK